MPLNKQSALNLASPTKTQAQWAEMTPRWLLNLLPWVQVKAGVYRVNQVSAPPIVEAEHSAGVTLPESAADYETVDSLCTDPPPCQPSDPPPRVIHLTQVQTVVKVHSLVADLYSQPHDQLQEQLRIAVAAIKEEKERRIVNSPQFGLLPATAPSCRISTGGEAPTPDGLDELLSLVWKTPAFFLAHPRALASFGRECSSRGVVPETVEIFGSPFMTWRGVPLVPSDKVPIVDGDGGQESSILLLRVGEAEQGVVGLHQQGVGDDKLQSLRVRKMRVDDDGVASYLLTCYFAVAVLTDDAVGVLENVRV